MWSLKKFTSAYLFQIAREKSCDYLLIIHLKKLTTYLKPLTIHLLLRYTEGIAFNLLKLGKASKIFGDLRRSPEIAVSLRKSSDDLRKHSEVFGRSSEIFGRFRVVFRRLRTVFGNLRKVSHDLRRSSKYIGWPPAVFVLTSDIFVVICTRVSLFCTVLTKNALLFSQSEPSNFFKCIIISDIKTLHVTYEY